MSEESGAYSPARPPPPAPRLQFLCLEEGEEYGYLSEHDRALLHAIEMGSCSMQDGFSNRVSISISFLILCYGRPDNSVDYKAHFRDISKELNATIILKYCIYQRYKMFSCTHRFLTER